MTTCTAVYTHTDADLAQPTLDAPLWYRYAYVGGVVCRVDEHGIQLAVAEPIEIDMPQSESLFANELRLAALLHDVGHLVSSHAPIGTAGIWDDNERVRQNAQLITERFNASNTTYGTLSGGISITGGPAHRTSEFAPIKWHGLVEQPARKLRGGSSYVQSAIESFRRLNADAFRASPRTIDSVIEILNLSVQRGFRPVATVDETDNSLEIEARFDPRHLLLLQVWPGGAADGLMFTDTEGFKPIQPTTVRGVLEWLVSYEDLGVPGMSVPR